jgi:maintenance of morphology protein 1
LDWFNVLIAQTIAQFRTDALADNAILTSLTTVLNGPHKPDFLTDIAVTEISLGEDFPIFSNCRVHPVADDDGLGQGRLQARMDVDLSDFITLGVETTMVLNYPRPRTAVLPVALSVSVVRFSGTLAISFLPASVNVAPTKNGKDGNGNPIPSQSRTPTSLAFSFMPNYTLSLSTRSLLGARSRLQDVPKIAQLVENRLRTWFEERCVQPRMQQVVVPSLWPRMKNVVEEGEGKDTEAAIDSIENSARAASTSRREAEAEFGNIVSGMTPERRGRGDLGEGLRRRVDQRTSERGRELGVSSQLPGPMPGTLVS